MSIDNLLQQFKTSVPDAITINDSKNTKYNFKVFAVKTEIDTIYNSLGIVTIGLNRPEKMPRYLLSDLGGWAGNALKDYFSDELSKFSTTNQPSMDTVAPELAELSRKLNCYIMVNEFVEISSKALSLRLLVAERLPGVKTLSGALFMCNADHYGLLPGDLGHWIHLKSNYVNISVQITGIKIPGKPFELMIREVQNSNIVAETLDDSYILYSTIKEIE